MVGRLWITTVLVTALVLALGAGAASAGPATVQLRVEGSSSTIFEGAVTTDGKTITKGGNTLACDGTSSNPPQTPGPTMTSALDDGLAAAGIPWEATFFNDFFISSVNGEANDVAGNRYWGYALNYTPVNVGGCQQRLQPGDEVLFAFDFFSSDPNLPSKPLLRLSGPPKVALGAQATLTVREGFGPPFAGASVAGSQTAADGTATVSFPSSGLVRVKAEAPAAIRSNAIAICVSSDGTGDCGVPPQQLGTPAIATGGEARDAKAPLARISGPRDGARYARGPRLLRGTASDEGTGVSVVKLALRRYVHGRNCRWWSGRRERFVGSHCRKVFFFAIGSDASWSYLLPRRLAPGRYVLDVKAFDRVRNRDENFVRGQNRIVFEVLRRR
jgi:uncharacterized protein DUF4430